MIANDAMRALLPLPGAVEAPLPEDLAGILERGWVVGGRGELVLADEPRPPDTLGPGPQQLMGAELDINTFGVDTWDLDGDRDRFLALSLGRAFRFVEGALRRAAGLPGAADLHGVVTTGIDEDYRMHGTKVRFFVRLGAAPDNYLDLDGYHFEAIGVVRLDDFAATGPLGTG